MSSTSHHGLVNQPTLEELAAEYVTKFNVLKGGGGVLAHGETYHIRQEMYRRFGEDRSREAIKYLFELNKILTG